MGESKNERQILGVNFFVGDMATAIERISHGGLLVVPAAPALKDLGWNGSYREALLNSDLVITDSAFMVLLWNLFERDSIPRLSGLRYLRVLLGQMDVRTSGNTLWVMACEASAQKNLRWLRTHGIEVPPSHVYLAPLYGDQIEDPALIDKMRQLRPMHVIITIGGGKQERLGSYIKRQMEYLPAIHCIGAAVAFLSGDQVRIPVWADQLYLGWLFRCISEPRRYIPRYWSALRLAPMLWRYRSRLPVEPGMSAVLPQGQQDPIDASRKSPAFQDEQLAARGEEFALQGAPRAQGPR
ncbi:MAG: WecB/TagA/CpsF family glycosyltransferase [Terracidiphilus sp.]|jgi:UDP-N-acetyl-D-mannosaminuronic acid transferase (WecB/TagA/CpsF family)